MDAVLERQRANMTEGAGLKLVAFEQTSARHLLDKLKREIKRIDDAEERALAQDHVTNAVWTAWFVHEWLWDAIKDKPELKAAVLEYRGIGEVGIDDHASFGAALAGRFVPLKICRMIARSPKQADVVLPQDINASSSAGVGAESGLNGHAHTFAAAASTAVRDKPAIVIMGKPVVASRLLEEVQEYWTTLIQDVGIEQLS